MRAGPFALCCVLFAPVLLAAPKFKVPWLSGPVIDEVGILEPQHRASLDQELRALNQSGVAQLQVYVTNSLQGLPIEQASIEIVDQWKLGDTQKDNGLLLLIAPNERKLRLEVGQGLEGVIPDVYAKRITEDVVVPYFKQGQMSAGVYAGVKAIRGVLGGEKLAEPPPRMRRAGGRQLSNGIILLFLILIILVRLLGGGRRSSGVFWGGGGFGGGRGGGWSGGGGGFSGGGSSSSW